MQKEIIQRNNSVKFEKIQRNNSVKFEKIQRNNLAQLEKIQRNNPNPPYSTMGNMDGIGGLRMVSFLQKYYKF